MDDARQAMTIFSTSSITDVNPGQLNMHINTEGQQSLWHCREKNFGITAE